MQRGAKKDIDPEELMRRKFRAKCLFRRIGRLAMANTFWLIEDIDEYKGVEDVKRRVEQAVRGRAKRQLLSIKDKALLNKPAEDRTEHEKKYLYRIIGGLKCFKRYPNHVKRKLAAATYFRYYGPHRVVVRHHQEAHALYFIVSGEVVVSQMIYDELLEEYVNTEVGEMGAGDMFGEISLLHNIPRTATVTTTDHCEFLMLLKEDFKNILLTSVQKQWDEVKRAMMSFTYFDSLDEVSFREGCIVAKMKKFAENETILGDGVGVPNHVYFILSGRIQMIEAIQVFVTTRHEKIFYTLYDPYETPEPSEEDFEKKWFAAYNKRESSGSVSKKDLATSGTRTRSSAALKQSILKQTSGSKIEVKEGDTEPTDASKIEVEEGGINETKTSTIEVKEGGVEKTETENTEAEKTEAEKTETENTETEKTETEKSDAEKAETSKVEGEEGVETVDASVGPDVTHKRTSFAGETDEVSELDKDRSTGKLSSISQTRRHSRTSGSKLILAPSGEEIAAGRQSVRYSVVPPSQFGTKRTLKTFFMQVCIMNPGSTFGFGENMRDRRMVALTPVHCMLIPKIWLLQRNTANIWTRIQYYLGKKIPNKQQLFEEFTKQREWEDYKKQCVEDVVAHSKLVNSTTLHDVPYSIRLEEMFDC